jgi:hypothetical protein
MKKITLNIRELNSPQFEEHLARTIFLGKPEPANKFERAARQAFLETVASLMQEKRGELVEVS